MDSEPHEMVYMLHVDLGVMINVDLYYLFCILKQLGDKIWSWVSRAGIVRCIIRFLHLQNSHLQPISNEAVYMQILTAIFNFYPNRGVNVGTADTKICIYLARILEIFALRTNLPNCSNDFRLPNHRNVVPLKQVPHNGD